MMMKLIEKKKKNPETFNWDICYIGIECNAAQKFYHDKCIRTYCTRKTETDWNLNSWKTPWIWSLSANYDNVSKNVSKKKNSLEKQDSTV